MSSDKEMEASTQIEDYFDQPSSVGNVDFTRYVFDKWPLKSARLIQNRVDIILGERGRCSVMLTGGRSAEQLYTAWRDLSDFKKLSGVVFFFGDERCVSSDSVDSNYGMAMRTLFSQGVPAGCSVCRMEAEHPDRDAAALQYEKILPDKLDVVLFGVGDDGHIASLFPFSPALHENNRRVLPVLATKRPYARLTITPAVIAQSRSIFVLAPGVIKGAALKAALLSPNEIDGFPSRLVLNATWLLDMALPETDF